MRQLKAFVHIPPEEHVLLVQRMHGSELWLRVIPYGIVICLLSFFSFFLIQSGIVGVMLLFGLLLYAMYQILFGFLRWDTSLFILTPKRLIFLKRDSLWRLPVIDIELSTIHHLEVIAMKGWRKWFRLSSVVVKGLPNTVMQLSSVSKATQFAESLKDAKKNVYST